MENVVLVILTSSKNHHRVINKFNSEERKIINYVMKKDGTLFGNTMYSGQYNTHIKYSTGQYINNILGWKTFDENEIYDLINRYIKILQENKDEVYIDIV